MSPPSTASTAFSADRVASSVIDLIGRAFYDSTLTYAIKAVTVNSLSTL